MVERRGASVDIVNLRKEFGEAENRVVAVDNVSLKIARGEFVCIVGPSGCGKVHAVAHSCRARTADQRYDHGRRFRLAGRERHGVSGKRTVPLDGCRDQRRLRPDDPRRCEVRDRRPCRGWAEARRPDAFSQALIRISLSGGMRQRGAIARAFVTDPGMLLMDEPFAALDAQNRTILQARTGAHLGKTGKTVIYITHSIEEALLLGDRTIVMTAQPGKIKEIIDIPFSHPRDVMALSSSAEFGKLKLDIWRILESEVQRARAELEL